MQANKNRVEPQQLIDQHKIFDRNAIENVRKAIPNVQKDYYSVAIIGVQNSGKSTLLNNLFGTNFKVLHEMAGTRTTRGILVSLDKQENLMIMDVEGNDAIDRAQHQEYEKMVSTFALVSADVLIINIWAKALGQYTGSQYQTLNIILDICISQFKQESPKTILFCVRDFNDEVDDERQIRTKIVKDVNNIWLKAQKPAQYEKYQNTPEKFFTVQVAPLRKYKKQNPKAFLQDVKTLRKRFISPKQDGYIFTNKKTAFNLPIDDLPQLLQNSWQSIKSNKKLNLPNQKEQLSNYRCSQILNNLSLSFRAQIALIQRTLKPVDFGRLFERFDQQFKVSTYNYGHHIVQQKQKVLEQEMKDTIQRVINQILSYQEKLSKDEYRMIVELIMQDTSRSLGQKLIELKNESVSRFGQVFKTLNYEQQNRKQRIDNLIASLDSIISDTKKKALDMIKADFANDYSRVMRLLSSEVLKKYFGISFWNNVDHQCTSKKKDLMKKYEKDIAWAEDRTLEPHEIDEIDQKMTQQLKKTIREQLQKTLVNRAFEIFMQSFTKSREGVPYNFNILEQDKIKQLYQFARNQAQDLITLINSYKVQRSTRSSILQFEQKDTADEFFEPTWLNTALSDLDKKMIHEHQTVIRRKKQSQMKKVPIWLFVVIMYFCYDDLWFQEENYWFVNKLLTVVLIFVAFFFSIGQHKVLFELWGICLDGIRTVVDLIRGKIKK